MTAVTSIDDIKADFEFLESWEDRFKYVMDLGRSLPAFPEASRNDTTKVRGCASQVWLASHVDGAAPGRVMTFDGDSDSHLVKGLIAVLFALYQGRPAAEVAAIDAHAILKDLGLEQALTPQRSNGLASMVARIRDDARQALA
jgi:cysteine desulfuration protein SufE